MINCENIDSFTGWIRYLVLKDPFHGELSGVSNHFRVLSDVIHDHFGHGSHLSGQS
ncbi:hypothetical protein DPMN_116574 [Dreissena polymorpha]|uniref:Uncharacterized protein n=1 Tax=Dreissena polymorpha TaxID=45954 RepID=A0A9D4KNA0_DREPO|nr:hypothetical protein DPMN_116574 [Dreissena polymorpha]